MRTLHRLERHTPKWLWENLATISILGMLAVLTVFAVIILSLIGKNRDRIDDIQASRVESCQRTYEGIREVFQPLFPPPKVQTVVQRRGIVKFNMTIDRLKDRCTMQTKPKGTK